MMLSFVTRRRLFFASIFVVAYIIKWELELKRSNNITLSWSSSYSHSPHTDQSLPLATVPYAISITSCSPKLANKVFDAAVVLKRSIELNSYPMHPESRYAAKFYAFTLNPEVDRCHTILSLAGFEVLPQQLPVEPDIIQEPEGSSLKTGIRSDGCCGHSELIKLATYKLDEVGEFHVEDGNLVYPQTNPIAVHLDLDTLVLRPMDELFNVMYFSPESEEGNEARKKLVEVVAPTYFDRLRKSSNATSTATPYELIQNLTIDAFFTKDYNMIVPSKHSNHVGVQGGFLVLRPSLSTFHRIVNLIYTGEYYPGQNAKGTGWFKSGYGNHIWGSMTIQGFMAYYFDVLEKEHSIELNRCYYNQIADNPRVSTFATNPKFPRGTLLPFVRNETNPRYNFVDKKCRDGRDDCEDTNCQKFPVNKTRLAHYTYCKVPWSCINCNYLETYKEPTCYGLLREWFRVRRTLNGEEKIGGPMVDGSGNDLQEWQGMKDGMAVQELAVNGGVVAKGGSEDDCYKEYFWGYCKGEGQYIPIEHRNFSARPDNENVTPIF